MRASQGLNEVGGRPVVPVQHCLQRAVGADHGRAQVVGHAFRPAAFAQNGHAESRRESDRSRRDRPWRNARCAGRLRVPARAPPAPAGVEGRIEADRQQRDAVPQPRVAGDRRWTALNCRSIFGQKSGNGQRVYMNVTASTLPCQSAIRRGVPVSSTSRTSGTCSPGWSRSIAGVRHGGRQLRMTDSLERREIAG